jgi:uncharacterized protein YegP (UPF0339 family)
LGQRQGNFNASDCGISLSVVHFSIYKSHNDQYYWEIKGDNYETMAVSETYVSKASAEHAIQIVKSGAASGAVLDHTDGTRYDRAMP